MKNILETIGKEARDAIVKADNSDNLREIEIKYLGRKGQIPTLLRDIPNLKEGDRKAAGQLGNILRKELEELVKNQYSKLELGKKPKKKAIDITAPSIKAKRGHLHPISRMIRDVENIFGRLGFMTVSGPEIEDDWHNFEALNFPPDHPAREMQDTFFVSDLANHVLRTQTSNMQIRFMSDHKPPIRIVAPGKTYRKDSDATHSPMFHQFEGLMIDKNISLSHLKWVMKTALSKLLGKDIELRFRLSFFPFTEPSLEVDATCVQCEGKNPNCRVCKGTGWLEIGGAGMVHPNVLKNCGIDPDEWNGFAFGCGIERIIMLKHQIDDLRLFFENDLRFLEQF